MERSWRNVLTNGSGSRLRLLIDLDGVLYRGKAALPGVSEFFDWIRANNHSYSLVTNNATRTPKGVAKQLEEYGIAVAERDIMTSAIGSARWLRGQTPDGARVQALGGPGLFQALYGPEGRFTPDWSEPEWVVAGLDQDLTYSKLTNACLAIQRGAKFVATNPDTTLPTEEGIVPGAGSIQAVISLVTGTTPVVIGKPEPVLYEMALRSMDCDGDVIVIGDRLDTDILAGQRINATTALVLTGVSTREQAERGDIKPDYIFENLNDMVRNWPL